MSAARPGDWLTLWAARRVRRTHVTTDPACWLYEPTRPGSRLDQVARGICCERCAIHTAPGVAV